MAPLYKIVLLIQLLLVALAQDLSQDLPRTPTVPAPLARRTDNYGSWCDSDVGTGLAGHYQIGLRGWGGEPGDTCGAGLLDNLRGQCGDVDDWGCAQQPEQDNGAYITFYLSGPRYAHCIGDAVWDASPPEKRETGFCCTFYGSGCS